METWTSHAFISISGWAKGGCNVYVIQDQLSHTRAAKLP